MWTRSADDDRGSGRMWEILSAARHARWDAGHRWTGLLEQVSQLNCSLYIFNLLLWCRIIIFGIFIIINKHVIVLIHHLYIADVYFFMYRQLKMIIFFYTPNWHCEEDPNELQKHIRQYILAYDAFLHESPACRAAPPRWPPSYTEESIVYDVLLLVLIGCKINKKQTKNLMYCSIHMLIGWQWFNWVMLKQSNYRT